MTRDRVFPFLSAFVSVLVLVACGGEESNTTSAPTSTEAPLEETTVPPTTTTSPPETTEAPETTVDPDAVTYPREVTHERGTFTQDAPPERVFVAASEIFGEAAIALGVTPVGRLDWFGGAPDPIDDDYGFAELDAVPVLGMVFAPNAEQILAAEPDLAFVFAGFQDAVYDTLSPGIDTVAITSRPTRARSRTTCSSTT